MNSYKTHLALKQLSRLHPIVQDMLVAAVTNKVWKSPDVKTRLDNLSGMEGRYIGGLALALIGYTAPASAVDEWIYRYLALIELDDRFVWFWPMLNVMKEVGSEGEAQRLQGLDLELAELLWKEGNRTTLRSSTRTEMKRQNVYVMRD